MKTIFDECKHKRPDVIKEVSNAMSHIFLTQEEDTDFTCSPITIYNKTGELTISLSEYLAKERPALAGKVVAVASPLFLLDVTNTILARRIKKLHEENKVRIEMDWPLYTLDDISLSGKVIQVDK